MMRAAGGNRRPQDARHGRRGAQNRGVIPSTELLDLFGLAPAPAAEPAGIVFQRSEKARNYRLTLRRDGQAVAIIPARGSQREAERFVATHQDWLDRAQERASPAPAGPPRCMGSRARRPLARGDEPEIPRGRRSTRGLAAQHPPHGLPRGRCLSAGPSDRRPAGPRWRRSLRGGRRSSCRRAPAGARRADAGGAEACDRPQSALALGLLFGRRHDLRLNWRLVQSPDFVRDYIIYHELAHLWRDESIPRGSGPAWRTSAPAGGRPSAGSSATAAWYSHGL